MAIVDELFVMRFVFSSLDYYASLNHSQNYFFCLGRMRRLNFQIMSSAGEFLALKLGRIE